MAYVMWRRGGFLLGALLTWACGGGASDAAAPDSMPFTGVAPVSPAPGNSAAENPAPVEVTPMLEPPPVLAPPEPPPEEAEEAEEPAVDPNVCRAPDGVSARPQNLAEAVALMNALPRPTTLECFVQALERPLQVFMTRSNQSLQPSPGARSPRTFIVNEPLVMSIVFEGDAKATLELGYRTAERRSIKTELVFPLRADVTPGNLFDEIKEGQVTRCSACHTSETQIFNAEIQADVFESDIYEPFDVYDVDIESVRAENASCDPMAEPERCALLSALFDHGDVVPAPEGILFSF